MDTNSLHRARKTRHDTGSTLYEVQQPKRSMSRAIFSLLSFGLAPIMVVAEMRSSGGTTKPWRLQPPEDPPFETQLLPEVKLSILAKVLGVISKHLSESWHRLAEHLLLIRSGRKTQRYFKQQGLTHEYMCTINIVITGALLLSHPFPMNGHQLLFALIGILVRSN